MKEKITNFSVISDHSGKRIDKFLQSCFTKKSRTKIQSLIRDGFVKVNNNVIYESSKKIRTNDKLEIIFPPPKKNIIQPKKISLNILYDDEDIIIGQGTAGLEITKELTKKKSELLKKLDSMLIETYQTTPILSHLITLERR